MSTLVLLLITGVGLGALYFLVASGLSLIYGLMHVLNFAHGAFHSLGGLLGWLDGRRDGRSLHAPIQLRPSPAPPRPGRASPRSAARRGG